MRLASYGAAVVNINSKSAARKKVREAQMKANEARLEREHHNVDDAASFLVELGRLGAVDEWEQGRIVEIRAEGSGGGTNTAGCRRAAKLSLRSRSWPVSKSGGPPRRPVLAAARLYRQSRRRPPRNHRHRLRLPRRNTEHADWMPSPIIQ